MSTFSSIHHTSYYGSWIALLALAISAALQSSSLSVGVDGFSIAPRRIALSPRNEKACFRRQRLWEFSPSQSIPSTALRDTYDSGVDEASIATTSIDLTDVSLSNNGSASLNGSSKASTEQLNGMLLELQQQDTGDDIPKPTANGGYSHTAASRAKIGAANKGKTPWNKGKERSEAVRARISAGVKAANRARFLKKLEEQGITEEEYNEQKKEEKRQREAERRARKTAKGGYRPTEETREKISKVLKEKYSKGEIKRKPRDPATVRRGFTHSEETRRKISESLKNRWKNDPEYREKMKAKAAAANTDDATRQRISESLRKKWQDPEFRNQMMEKMSSRRKPTGPHNDAHREKISMAMRAKWQDEEYRQKTVSAIRKKHGIRSSGETKPRPARPRSASTTKTTKPTKTKKKAAPRTLKQKAPSVVQPRKAPSKEKLQAAKAATARRKTVKGSESSSSTTQATASTTNQLPDAAAAVEPTIKKTASKKKTTKKRKSSPRKKKDEPDGSVNRLKEERRDLFELLYGDDHQVPTLESMEDDIMGEPSISALESLESEEDMESEDMAMISSLLQSTSKLNGMLEDENLDDFDPYGLDDY